MMCERADLGLIRHLTAHELRLTAPGEIVHAWENSQGLQQLAAAAVNWPGIAITAASSHAVPRPGA
jgi:hypothetical protein